jgi:glycosyltransferase involved in cell wall biosynthesis
VRLLFIHQGFPGQYIHVLRALSANGNHQLVGLGMQEPDCELPSNVQYYRYGVNRGNQTGLHPWVQDIETKVIRAEACAEAAMHLKQQSFQPDLICGHPGWGELLFIKDIWPETPLLTYQEFFYNTHGFDYDFDAEFQSNINWQKCARIRMKTANQLLNLEASTWSVTPTQFQRKTFPKGWRDQMSVIHDGIDTKKACPNKSPIPIKLSDKIVLNPGEKIVTFVNRNLEPYRGCHTMIRAIPKIQKLAPDAKLILVGQTTGVSYGATCSSGEWKDHFLKEIEGNYDPSRVIFTGNIPYEQFIPLLQLSQAHVYLTYPFVLSWSLLEAMSCGCAVVGSNTAPVQEVIKNGKNGLLVDFFDSEQLAETIAELLKNRELAEELGQEARKTVLERFELNSCVQRQLALMDLVANRSLGQ